MEIISQILFFIQSFVLAVTPTTQFVEGVTGQPDSFLPHQISKQSDTTISNLIYRGLFDYDIYGNLVPDLAESWEVSADGKVYTVTLKPNQVWTDGSQITADDVIYTAFKHPLLQGVGTDKVDDRTVRFYLPNRFSPFLSMLTVGIMQDQSEENFDALVPASNGEFRVLRVQRSGPIVKEVVLISNDPTEQLRKLVFRYYGNEEELVTAARLGEIDGFVANKEYELENFTNHKFPQQGVYYAMFFNLEDEAVKELALRQKLEKVINKPQVIYDKGISVEGPISRNIFTNREVAFNPYDEDIKEDLDLELAITIPDIETHDEVATRVSTFWDEKLDVDLDIIKRDPEDFVDEVVNTRDYQILLYGQEVGRDPGRYVNWHSTQANAPGLNLSRFEHVKSDRALEEGRKEIDNDARTVHYDEFQKVVVEQVPAIFLYHPYRNYYVSNYISGIGDKYTYTAADRFLDFSNWDRVVTN